MVPARPPLRARPAAVPKPRVTRRGVAAAAAAWLLYSAVYSAFIVGRSDVSYPGLLLGQLWVNFFLALYSVPVWLLVVRGMDERGWRARLAAHALAAPVYVAAGMATLFGWAAAMDAPGVMAELRVQARWIAFGYLTAYVVQFAVYHTVRSAQRSRAQERIAAELEALAHRQGLAVLKAQLNPHFLFNTLNSISATIARDAEGAREMVAALAELLRYALRTADDDVVPLRDELHMARTYLELERRRFPDRLRLRYEVEEEALDALVPAMALQPLAENAVRHGIAPSESGGEVTLRVHRRGRRVEVSVHDTGAGAARAPSSGGLGIGLANTDARLRGLFGEAAGLAVATTAGGGFRVGFSLPAPDAKAAASAPGEAA